MKKIYALALLFIPLCLTMGFIIPTWTEGGGEQEQKAQIVPYGFESDYYSVQEMGKLLERFGREIQRDGSVTIGGRTYPMTGFGKVEMSVKSNGIGMSVGAGLTEPKPEWKSYEVYKRSPLSRRGTTTAVAEILAKVGKNLASSGNIVMEDYSVALEGNATVTLRLVRALGKQRTGYGLDIAFGKGDLLRPNDEEDLQDKVEQGEATVLAEREFTDVNQARLAKQFFASLSRDLRADRVSVGDQELAAGETTGLSFQHEIAKDGQSHRVSISFEFGPLPPRRQRPKPDEPKYGKETVGRLPIKDIGQLLKSIGTEILESETITFEGVAYRAGKSGNYELGMRHDRFNIELGTNDSPPTPPKK